MVRLAWAVLACSMWIECVSAKLLTSLSLTCLYCFVHPGTPAVPWKHDDWAAKDAVSFSASQRQQGNWQRWHQLLRQPRCNSSIQGV